MTTTPLNPSGLCLCGCGGRAPVAKYTHRARGYVKGEPLLYIAGHNGRAPENRKRLAARNRTPEQRARAAWSSPRRAAASRANARKRWEGHGAHDVDYLLADPCAYCGAPAEEFDHITPVRRPMRKAGAARARQWENLTGACGACNRSKGTASLLMFMARRVGYWQLVAPEAA